MKKFNKAYVAIADWLICLLKENKRLMSFVFVCNLTYLAQIYSMGSVLEGYHGGNEILVHITIFFMLQIFVTTLILAVLPKIFARIFIGLSVIFFVVDAFILALHRSLFDKSMFQVLLDTNFQESMEFIENYSTLFSTKILWILPLAIGLVLCFKAIIALIDFWVNLRNYLARFVRFVMIFGLMSAALFSWNIATDYTFFPRIGVSVVRMTALIAGAFKEIYEYQEVYKKLDNVKIEITRNESDLPWVIFVLGESTGRCHLSLYGYEKMTNPLLQRRLDKNELVLFSDCISGADLTMLSCERLFTFYDNRTQISFSDSRTEVTDKPWYQYPNLFDILKAAGYHTTWLSNQESSGIYGNVPRAYADRCDEKNFTVIRDTTTFVYEFDEKLLPLLDESLQKNTAQKNFYVLHLLGTHADYRLRFPNEYEVFKADDEPAAAAWQRDYQADYDNAVLYNDFVVDEIIKRFENKDALIIYISDHGEAVFEDNIHYGHGPGPGGKELDIPMIVWTSETFKKNHPELMERITAAKDLPFMTDDMIHALLDLMKIETADFDSRKSLFSKDFDATRKRIYRGREYVNGKMIPLGS